MHSDSFICLKLKYSIINLLLLYSTTIFLENLNADGENK